MEQPTINYDIIGLFDKVRKQADAYANIYEMLTRKSYELDRQRHDTHIATMDFKQRSETSLKQFQDDSRKIQDKFQHEISHVEELYNELYKISEISKDVEQLQFLLNSRAQQVDEMIKTISSIVKRETEKEFLSIEKKIATKIQYVDNLVATFDSRLYSIQEFQKREVTVLGDEIDRFKSKIAETKYIVDETSKIVHNTVENAELQFNEKMNKFYIEVEDRVNKVIFDLTTEKQNLSARAGASGSDITYLNNRVKELSNKVNFSAVVASVIGVIALIISLLAIIKK
ncbi:MAG: hypothetical protein JNJ85_03120 [Candidatus Kapabacteria bacterium]|nr:hypothetical protein [Candidatus Kapabacteria bacterium]